MAMLQKFRAPIRLLRNDPSRMTFSRNLAGLSERIWLSLIILQLSKANLNSINSKEKCSLTEEYFVGS